MTWERWKPVAIFLALGSLVGTLLSFDALFVRISDLLSSGPMSFTGIDVCNVTSDRCTDTNPQLAAFLSENAGETVQLDFRYAFSAAGRDYVACAEKGISHDPQFWEDDVILPLQLSRGACRDVAYLSMDQSAAREIATAMAFIEYRIIGDFTIGVRSYGGAPMYTLISED